MLRFFRSKWFIVSFITLVLIIVMGVSASKSSKLNWLNNIVSVPMKPVQGFLSSVGRKAEDILSYFKDIEAVKKENDILRSEVAELKKTKQRAGSAKEQE